MDPLFKKSAGVVIDDLPLNALQREAVAHRKGPAIVVAGAGTGKTRILEYRTLSLVREGVHPSSILLITFTREAAQEMLTRAARHNTLCRFVEGGTFHAFALKMLREEASAKGYNQTFSVLDEEDAENLLKQCMDDFSHREEPDKKLWPPVNIILEIFHHYQIRGWSLEESIKKNYWRLLQDKSEDHIILPQVLKFLEELYVHFRARKRAQGLLQFDDLLEDFRDLLKNPDYQKAFGKRFRYIMVDEFQDTNPLEEEIVHLMGQAVGNILVVGDDAQSIYGFRGSSPRNLTNFEKAFSDRLPRRIVLKENYRSTQAILDLANAISDTIENVIPRRLKVPQEQGQNEKGEKPRFHVFSNPIEEAEWVSNSIWRNKWKENIPLNEIAVLFRSTSASKVLQVELNKRNIPYVLWGGKRFTELPHVKDFLAFFRVVHKPSDIVAWPRLFRIFFPISPSQVNRWNQYASQATDLGQIIFDHWPLLERESLSATTAKEKFKDLNGLREILIELYRLKNNPASMAEKVFQIYLPLMSSSSLEEKEENKEDLQILVEMATEAPTLEAFLDSFSLEPPRRGARRPRSGKENLQEPQEMLVLSTIHSAKGREWHTVYFMGLADGQLPHSRCQGPQELQEEHRLFYVGVTRAKRQLFLTMHERKNKSEQKMAKPSRFLIYREVWNNIAHL
ncbi:MAG: ATP-dependent helicase [Flavobacteriales bacterium]|nr:ATP-dependent helicase [Flavobacteriales bacterium]MCX7768397.1 ATP-dependent helicase [Flavobacteriales bacterium]MDW8409710.1 ATP-dependent helicase [Flavobacteriales bacterium]